MAYDGTWMKYTIKDGAPRAECSCGWSYLQTPDGDARVTIYDAGTTHQEEVHA